MNIRKELPEIPDALRQMCEEGLPLYDAVVRRFNWAEKPVFIVADGLARPAAISGAWAFESVLGLPAVVQSPEHFCAYTSRALTARSLVIMISGANKLEETLAAARKAKSRGALVWAVTPDTAGDLAALADAAVNNFAAESAPHAVRSIFCRHAAMVFLAVAAAKVLKAPSPALSAREEELEKLAQQARWVLEQIPDAATALAREMAGLSALYVTGGGAFYPIALQAAEVLGQICGNGVHGLDLPDIELAMPSLPQTGAGILYLSSSRCGMKAHAHQSVRNARQRGKVKILAVTDSNDRQLSERADMAVLLPILTEAGGALLTLVLLELAASDAARHPRRQIRPQDAGKP